MVRYFVVMGVSGCGKSTVAAALARAWDLAYVEGDDLHGAANVAKMASGMPLTDADRWPWLDRIGAALAGEFGGAVASCSALRRAYRDRLRHAVADRLGFIMIDLDRSALEQRMLSRSRHYMPVSLLDSQLRTLERPEGEPDTLILDGSLPVDAMVALASRWRDSI